MREGGGPCTSRCSVRVQRSIRGIHHGLDYVGPGTVSVAVWEGGCCQATHREMVKMSLSLAPSICAKRRALDLVASTDRQPRKTCAAASGLPLAM